MKKKLLFLLLFCTTISNISVQAFAQASAQKAKEYELITDENGEIQKILITDTKEIDKIEKQMAYEKSLYTYYPVTNTHGALTFDFNNPNYIPIVDYIKQNIDENFDLSIYEVQPPFESQAIGYKNGDGHVKFNLIMNGIKTDIVYTAKIRENIVTEIMLYKTPIYNLDMSQIPDTLAGISEEEIKAMSINPEMLEAGFEVAEQTIEMRFDSATMKPYYIVFNTYRSKSNPNYETMDHFIYGLEE